MACFKLVAKNADSVEVHVTASRSSEIATHVTALATATGADVDVYQHAKCLGENAARDRFIKTHPYVE